MGLVNGFVWAVVCGEDREEREAMIDRGYKQSEPPLEQCWKASVAGFWCEKS
jgi:hypothetical protein